MKCLSRLPTDAVSDSPTNVTASLNTFPETYPTSVTVLRALPHRG